MKQHTRRVIAYIAGRLISKSDASSIYDFEEKKYFSFNGEVKQGNITIYDCREDCKITGQGTSGSYNLYHHGNNKHISLDINEKVFRGFDYDTRGHFTGTVEGNSINICILNDSKYFQYSI